MNKEEAIEALKTANSFVVICSDSFGKVVVDVPITVPKGCRGFITGCGIQHQWLHLSKLLIPFPLICAVLCFAFATRVLGPADSGSVVLAMVAGYVSLAAFFIGLAMIIRDEIEAQRQMKFLTD